jgi:galactonate dehydratase
MKIARIECFMAPPRWLFVRVETDCGLVGWGEPIVEGRASTVRACVGELGECLISRDPRRVEDIFQTLYRGGFYRGGPVLMSAIAGIEQALWDIKGQALGVPVHELLGGPVRDKMRVYAWCGGDNPGDLIDQARARQEQGFTAVKVNALGPTHWVDSMARVSEVMDRLTQFREAFGMDLDFAIDFHGRCHQAMARPLVAELDALRPLFIEEPVLSEHPSVFAELRRHTNSPLAAGERLYSRWDFRPFFESGAIDIAQPDPSHAGGIWEIRKIAAMAETYDIALAPHCPLGPISFASAIHLDFACPNAFIQECSLGIHYNEGADLLTYVTNPEFFNLEDGMLTRPERPGLGVQIDEEKVRTADAAGDHRWRNPIWRHADGSIVEW